MILILSSNITDSSTTNIIKYLKKLNIEYLNITPIGIAFKDELEIINDKIFFFQKQEKKELIIDKIKCIYLRKWDIEKEINFYLSSKNNDNIQNLKSLYISEINAISNYLFYRLKNCKWLSNFESLYSNKLTQSYEAKMVGLNTPNFSIISNRNEVNNFEKKTIITKLINTHFSFYDSGNKYFAYSKPLKKINSNSFFPSYVQENIKKDFEIRTFYLNRTLYSFAIFSQDNNQTKNDLRQYDLNNLNTVTPYILDLETTNKIITLMDNLNLTIGSIDLIMSKSEKIYFLEINPFGQYDYLSKRCNYNLDEKIVEYLINENE